MKKLSYMALWLIGIMGTLSVWVANADTPTVTHSTVNVVPDTYTLNWNTGFTAWTITVTDWTTTITILDRNLWATAAWTWCEDINYDLYHPKCSGIDNTYWYLFQWWNNYWFPSHWELSNMSSTLVSSPINIPYSSSTFITGHSNWMNDNNVVNLWWWTTNDSSYNANNRQITNAQERQWPCPDWFHVPSAWELYKLFLMFNNDASDIHENLKIPYAGRRQPSDNALSAGALREQGYRAGLLSSSINSNDKSNYSYWSMIIYTDSAFINNDSRSTAQSVRCFYNNYAEYSEPESTEVTEITISWITEPVLWAYPVTWWITITSTPEGAVHIANSWWSDFNWYTLCNPMWTCSNDRDTSYFSNQDSAPNKKYYLVINYVIDDWYELADNATITTNWNWTVTTPKTGFVQLTYNASDLQAAPAPTEIPEITISWITLPVAWAVPTTEWIVSATTWITVSNRNTIWNMNYDMVRCSVDTQTQLCGTDLPMFKTWVQYAIQIPFTIDEWYGLADQFSTNNVTDGLGNNASEMSISNRVLVFTYTATGAQNQSGSWEGWDESWEWNNWWSSSSTSSSSSSSSSWWGGGGWKIVTKTDTKIDETKAEETKQEENKAGSNENKDELNIPERTQEELQKVLEDGLTQEFHDAYDFAYKNGITTMPTAKDANMKSPLTRIAMAKMLSNYAINLLWKKPANKVVPKFPDIDEKLNEDYGWAVDLAYQLWIMWIWIENFRPFDLVPRAEFVTALSRMLYWTADWEWAYYETHMKKLKEEWIITNDNPNLQEVRWYVMIMLMRSAK